LIEADLQILLHLCFGLRNEGEIEDDCRIFKFNFGARKNYSVENENLEKRLLYESNLFTENKMVHYMSDLEACYNRYIPEIGFMVEEAVGVHCSSATLFAKLIPRFEHKLCSSYGISEIVYGGEVDLLGGSGKGNFLSGAKC